MFKLSIIFLPIVLSIFTGLIVYENLCGKLTLISNKLRNRKTSTNDFDEYLQKLIPDDENRKEFIGAAMKERSDMYRVVRYLIMGLSLLGAIFFSSILLEPFWGKLPAIFGKIGSGLATIGVMFIALKSWSLQSYNGTTRAEKLKDAILFTLWTAGIVLVFFSE